jgi:hypothetical protein
MLVSFQPCLILVELLEALQLVMFSNGILQIFLIPFILSLIFRFFNNEGCLGAAVETLFSAGTLILFLMFSQAGVTINSILMLFTGALNCGADIILCKHLHRTTFWL